MFVYLFIHSFITSSALAQTSGISVSPSLVQLDFATDKPQADLTYTNNTNDTITLSFTASNITELEDGYKISYLESKNVQNFKYGLASWIEFSNSSLVIPPHTKSTLTIFIDKDKLSPGGHYGSVLAQVQQKTTQKDVTLQGIIASLIFVRTHTGKEYEKGMIETLSPEQTIFGFPKQFLLRFTNSGDTFLTPFGKVDITDSSGHFVARGILNEGSLMVLPESLRRYEIPVTSFSSLLLPGIYQATLTIHFGKTNQSKTSHITFFSFGNLPIMQLTAVLLLLAIAYFGVKKMLMKNYSK